MDYHGTKPYYQGGKKSEKDIADFYSAGGGDKKSTTSKTNVGGPVTPNTRTIRARRKAGE